MLKKIWKLYEGWDKHLMADRFTIQEVDEEGNKEEIVRIPVTGPQSYYTAFLIVNAPDIKEALENLIEQPNSPEALNQAKDILERFKR